MPLNPSSSLETESLILIPLLLLELKLEQDYLDNYFTCKLKTKQGITLGILNLLNCKLSPSV